MRTVRLCLLTLALGGLVWFSFYNSASAKEVAQTAWDAFDDRPARTILFIGNSRTFPHDMPYMVRHMADSAGAPQKYQIRMHALPGESFRGHWHNPRVHRLLDRSWDEVILQERSGAHSSEVLAAEFRRFGMLLTRKAAASGAKAILFVGWNYGDELFEGAPPGAEAAYYRQIQHDHRDLAQSSGARLANVGKVWRDVVAAAPPFELESDGNHPTLHGSYLTALVFYAHLSGDDVANVRYVPPGLSAGDAALLRRLVGSAL